MRGTISVAAAGGRLESDSRITLRANVVDIAGVVKSNLSTPDASDYEIKIVATDTARLTGDLLDNVADHPDRRRDLVRIDPRRALLRDDCRLFVAGFTRPLF